MSDDKLKARLQQIRELRSKGSGFEVQAMQKIVELEKTSVLWRKDAGTKFEEVLRHEKGLCTPSKFRAYKKASTHFPLDVINKLGVPCACLLAVQPAQTRDRILGHALKFRSANGCEPTYQYVCKFLRKPTVGPSRAQLLRYVDTLKKTIKDMGGRIPMMEHFDNR